MADELEMSQTSVTPPRLEEQLTEDVARSTKRSQHPGGTAAGLEVEGLGKAEVGLDEAKDRVRSFRRAADQYVRENPAKAVFSALGFGFVLGLIFRR